MDRSSLIRTFIDDAGSFIERLNSTLIHLEKDPENLNLVHQAFRFVHSIKSESSYLQIDGVTKAAHNLETLLDIIRRDKRRVEAGDMRDLYEGVDELQETFHTMDAQGEKDQPPEFIRPADSAPVPGEAAVDGLEKELLLEARQRGEGLYRLSCEIDESASMKKSRVFLLVNNLELIVNVLTVSPSLEEEQDELFRTCTILFTTDAGEDSVRDALRVDQVKRVQITRLEYDSFLQSGSGETPLEAVQPPRQDGFYRVSAETLEEVLEYMDQIKLNIVRLGGEGKNLTDLRRMTDSLESLLRDIRKVYLSSYFAGFGRLVRDLAEGLGKKADLEMDLGSLALDRNSAELLSDILVHLIRNAVDHGIETPEERLETGKPEYGTIRLTAEIRDGNIHVQLQDDGRGIDDDQVRRLARSRGLIEDATQEDLLKILALPGFSTREEATDYSGRGVGLDVIMGRLEKTRGGRLELETTRGDGSTFHVHLPLIYNPMGILLVRCGTETLAVPLKNIRDTFTVDPALYAGGEGGFLTYEDMPVYSTEGRLFTGKDLPEEKYGVILQHLGSRAVFLADELLFEKEIPEESLNLKQEIRPHLFSIGEGSTDPGYVYLNPSIISRNL